MRLLICRLARTGGAGVDRGGAVAAGDQGSGCRASRARCARPALDRAGLRRLVSDIVINSAAYTAVDKAEHEQEAVFAMNREGAALLARAAARRNIPVIHLSTHYVFDGAKPTAYDEDDPPSPATVYGRSKYEGECAVADANPRHVIIRTGWVFSTAANGFAARMLAQAGADEPLRVVADQRGNPTYAPHLAAAIFDIACRLAANPSETGTMGHLPRGRHRARRRGTDWHPSCSPAPQAETPRRSLEAIASSDYPALAPRPVNAALKCDKFERTFALRLPPWQQGVAECVEALRSR